MRRLLLALVFIAPALTAAPLAAVAAPAAQDPGAVQDTAQDTTAQDEAPPLAPLPQLAADLAAIKARIDEVEANLAAAPPESQAVFAFQRRRRWQEHHDVLGRLVEGIEREQARAEEDSLAAAEADSLAAEPDSLAANADSLVVDADSLVAIADSLVLAEARSALQLELVTIEAWLDDVSAEEATIRRALAVAPPTDFVRTQIELHRLSADIDMLFLVFTSNYERAAVLGLDLSAEQALHQLAVVERTELLGAALEQALQEEADYRDWITKPGVDTVAMALQIAATEERVLGVTESLRAMVELMDDAGLGVSDYRRLLVTATGDIGIEVLDIEVVSGLIAQWSEELFSWFRTNIDNLILNLVLIVAVLLLAGSLSRVVRGLARWFLSSKRVDLSSLVRNLVISGLANVVWIVAFFVMLSVVGIDLAPMLAGLGIAGFVIGFALQDTLGNFASGLMIMVYRPFDVGDWITAAGVSGTVKDLTVVSTVIHTVDNKRVTIPNHPQWEGLGRRDQQRQCRGNPTGRRRNQPQLHG